MYVCLSVCLSVCLYVHILMPGCPKKRTYIEFWNCGPQNIPNYSKIVKIFIYDNIYGLAWGGILSFPRKGLFMRGGIVKQGAHIYKLETYIHTYIYIDIYIYIYI